MKTRVALLVILLAGCVPAAPLTTTPPTERATREDVTPAAATAATTPFASPAGASPASGEAVAGSTDPACPAPDDCPQPEPPEPACEEGDEECFRRLLAEAGQRAEAIPDRVEIDEPPTFEGGQRTDSWVNYLADTIFLTNRFWSEAFAAGNVPYGHVNYVILDAASAPQTSNCTDEGQPAVARPEDALFYCNLGGQGFEYAFTSGTIYIGVPAMIETTQPINPADFDFAVVSIIAHEMGHHVQQQLLRLDYVSPLSATWMELGADCLTGVFAHNAYHGRAGQLEEGDYYEAVNLMHSIGMDLPYRYTGDPHGSREQRVAAFLHGYDSGNTSQCLSTEWPEDF